MCMTLHMSTLNLSCQVFNHRCRRSRSSCRVMLFDFVFIPHQTFVSSANISMSLMTRMATRSQIAEKATVLTHYLVELHSAPPESVKRFPALSITLIVLAVRKLRSHCNSLPLIPKPFSFSISLRCGTLSNASCSQDAYLLCLPCVALP